MTCDFPKSCTPFISLYIFSQVVKGRFHRIFSPSQSLDTVSSSDLLFCFEMLSKDLAKERVVLLKVQQVHHFHYLFFQLFFPLGFVGWCQHCWSICCFFSCYDFMYWLCLGIDLQRPQVPSIPITKCAGCLKPPASDDEKLKRCTRCYRVGYCNQWVSICSLEACVVLALRSCLRFRDYVLA